MILATSDFISESSSINIFPAWILDKDDTGDASDTCKTLFVTHNVTNETNATHYMHKKEIYDLGYIIPWYSILKERKASSHLSYS
jgi:hypothetical protein